MSTLPRAPVSEFRGGGRGIVDGVCVTVDDRANSASSHVRRGRPHLWKTLRGDKVDELKTFCEDAARQMVGLETRLRTLVAARGEHPELTLIREAVTPSLQLAKALFDAGRTGRHETLLALRPLLRALRFTDW